MMNTVGELVINRTRMVGRVAELEKLVDTLSFSKERLQGKVAEFQEKYEFNRISNNRTPRDRGTPSERQRCLRARLRAIRRSGPNSANWKWTATTDFNILSRSMAEISADVNEVLSQLQGFIGRVEGDIDEFTKLAHHCKTRLRPREWFRLARSTRIVARRSRCGELYRQARRAGSIWK